MMRRRERIEVLIMKLITIFIRKNSFFNDVDHDDDHDDKKEK